jgi:hypothetical protein
MKNSGAFDVQNRLADWSEAPFEHKRLLPSLVSHRSGSAAFKIDTKKYEEV